MAHYETPFGIRKQESDVLTFTAVVDLHIGARILAHLYAALVLLSQPFLKTLYSLLSHLTRHDLFILIMCGGEYKLLNPSLCNFLQGPVLLTLSGPNIPFGTLFSNTLPFNMGDQVSHPYTLLAKLYLLYFCFDFFNVEWERC
jgi:hypothetical protein